MGHGRAGEPQAPDDTVASRSSVRASFLALLDRRGVALAALYTPLGQDGPHHDLYLLAEGLIGYDQQFQQWRAAHLAMAERLLSKGLGSTGGSSGARYLAERLAKTCLFPQLWAVRAELWERHVSA